jgi:hypothetical protein
MAKAAQAISAKDFRDPLMKVLATQTRFDSGRTVKAEDLYGPICKMMGVNHEDYGETGGVLWVQKWIQWAFQALRDDGLGVKHGRGTWGLTPDGVDKARSMMMSATTNTLDQDVEALAELIAASSMESQIVDDGTYHPDPHLCSIGLKDHNCMGFFTDMSPMCVTCPARVLCQRQKMKKMASLADEMDAVDNLAVKFDVKQATPIANLSAADPDTRYQIPSGAVVQEQICASPVMCDHCGGMIKDGEANIWVRKVGPEKKHSLMLHRECCNR